MNSNIKSTVNKPKLSTTTADHTYDYRITPNSEMKGQMTPSKQAQNEISCEVTSQAFGDTCMKNVEAYKRPCSGFGDESIQQTPVSKNTSPLQRTNAFPSIFGCVQEISPIRPVMSSKQEQLPSNYPSKMERTEEKQGKILVFGDCAEGEEAKDKEDSGESIKAIINENKEEFSFNNGSRQLSQASTPRLPSQGNHGDDRHSESYRAPIIASQVVDEVLE